MTETSYKDFEKQLMRFSKKQIIEGFYKLIYSFYSEISDEEILKAIKAYAGN